MSQRMTCVLGVVLSTCAAAHAGGQTWFVDPVAGSDANSGMLEADAFETIGAGITAAANGDTVLLLPGTYTGPGNQSLSLQGKTITIEGRDGAASTIIDIMDIECASSPFNCEDRAFEVTGGQGRDLLFEGLTIRGGLVNTEAVPGDASGGAVLIDGSSPTFRACVIEDNEAFGQFGALGAAVFASGDPAFIDCEFSGNRGSGGSAGTGGCSGGAVFVLGDPEFDRCSFTMNRADGLSGDGTRGGAAAINGSARFTDCSFVSNRVGAGFVGGAGGAIHATSGKSGTTQIDRCVFDRNMVDAGEVWIRGGGVSVTGASVISNSLFIANRADSAIDLFCMPSEGAAVRYELSSASHQLVNCTIVGHTSDYAEAAVSVVSGNTVEAINTILWDNNNAFEGDVAAVSASNAIVQGGFPGASAADPLFADPMLDDYRLSAASPAIDAGDNAGIVGALDLDGNARRFDDPMTPDSGMGTAPIVDLGAYEFGAGPGGCNAADLAAPLGTLDFSDVTAFLAAFNAMSFEADLAAPIGVFDFSDVVAFLAAFGAGCP